MSNIRFFALGGLGENGKNLYVVDVDRKYYILDSGIKVPSSEYFGVDEIVSDVTSLSKIKKHVQGIFLSHAHEDHIGALTYLLPQVNVPVFATNFTMEIIKDSLREANLDLTEFDFRTVNTNTLINFGNVRVSFFQTTHSVPESVGIAIHTLEGVIVYTSDFTLVQSGDPFYQTDFRKISEIGDKNILALLVGSSGAGEVSVGGADVRLEHKINSIFTNLEGRILVSLYSTDLRKIQMVVDISIKHNRKIAVIGRRAQRMVDLALANGYLNIPKEHLKTLKYINDKVKNDDPDLVCLITGNRHEPFYMLQRICNRQDQLLHINEKDTVIMLTRPVSGTEKIAARTLDILYRSGASVHQVKSVDLDNNLATSDDIRLMISMLEPKFIIPVIGEFRHQYQVREIAKKLGYKEDNVPLLDNGDVFYYKEGGHFYIAKGEINAGEIFIDGNEMGDINEVVIHDREMLSSDGVLLIVGHIDPRRKVIVGEPKIETRGFVYIKESEDIIEGIIKVFNTVTDKVLKGKYIKWQEYKNMIRDAVINYIYQQTRRKPIVIPVIVAVEEEKQQ